MQPEQGATVGGRDDRHENDQRGGNVKQRPPGTQGAEEPVLPHMRDESDENNGSVNRPVADRENIETASGSRIAEPTAQSRSI